MLYIGKDNQGVVEYLLLRFKFIPPPVNHAYRIARQGNKGFIRFADHAEKFKKLVSWKLSLANLVIPVNWQYLKVEYLFLFEESEMMVKGSSAKNTIHQIDISNLFKLLEDSIHTQLDHDDRYVVTLIGHKRTIPDGSLSDFWFHPVKTKDFTSKRGFTFVRIQGVSDTTLSVSDILKSRFGFDYFKVGETEHDGSCCNETQNGLETFFTRLS